MNESEPAVGFRTMADQIAKGTTVDETRFNLFLELGVQHWGGLANAPDYFFAADFAILRDRYATASRGNNVAKTAFCKEEANYLEKEADLLAETGQREASETLKRRAGNWRAVPMNFTFNGR